MEIIKRKQWDKDKLPHDKYVRHTPKRIVVHHTYSPSLSQCQGIKTIRAIKRYHVETNGWADIGYHYLIDSKGVVYAGRDPLVKGAHCGGTLPPQAKRNFGNTDSLGICVVGNFDREQPEPVQLESLRALLEYLVARFRIEHKDIYGHCQCFSYPHKTCPGRNLFIELFGYNAWVDLRNVG